MDMGDRGLQILLGIPLFGVGLAVLVLPYLMLGEAPGKWQVSGGLAATVLGLWLSVPYGIAGLFEQAADSYNNAKGDDDG